MDTGEPVKPVAFVTDARLVPAEDVWPTADSVVGKFIMRANIVVDKPDGLYAYKDEIRTSIIQKIDIANGTVETKNTLYKIVPLRNTDVVRMLVPTT